MLWSQEEAGFWERLAAIIAVSLDLIHDKISHSCRYAVATIQTIAGHGADLRLHVSDHLHSLSPPLLPVPSGSYNTVPLGRWNQAASNYLRGPGNSTQDIVQGAFQTSSPHPTDITSAHIDYNRSGPLPSGYELASSFGDGLDVASLLTSVECSRLVLPSAKTSLAIYEHPEYSHGSYGISILDIATVVGLFVVMMSIYRFISYLRGSSSSKQQLADQQARLHLAARDLKDSESAKKILATKLLEKEDELQGARSARTAMDSHNSRLLKMLETARQDFVTMESAKKNAEADTARLGDEVMTTKRAFEKMEMAKNIAETKIGELIGELETSKQELRDLTIQKAKADTTALVAARRVLTLGEEVDATKSANSRAEMKVQTLQRTIENDMVPKSKLQKVEQELKRATTEVSHLGPYRKKSENHSAEIKKLQGRLKEEKDAREDDKKVHEERELTSGQVAEHLRQQFQDSTTEVRRLTAEKEQVSKENRVLHQQVHSSANESGRLTAEKKQAQREKAHQAISLEAEIARLAERNEEQQKKLKNQMLLIETHDDAVKEQDLLKSEITDLQEDKLSLRNQLCKAQNDEKTNTTKLAEEIASLRSQLSLSATQKRAQATFFENEKNSLQNKLGKAENDLKAHTIRSGIDKAALQTQLQQTVAELDSSSAELQNERLHATSLQEKITELEADLDLEKTKTQEAVTANKGLSMQLECFAEEVIGLEQKLKTFAERPPMVDQQTMVREDELSRKPKKGRGRTPAEMLASKKKRAQQEAAWRVYADENMNAIIEAQEVDAAWRAWAEKTMTYQAGWSDAIRSHLAENTTSTDTMAFPFPEEVDASRSQQTPLRPSVPAQSPLSRNKPTAIPPQSSPTSTPAKPVTRETVEKIGSIYVETTSSSLPEPGNPINSAAAISLTRQSEVSVSHSATNHGIPQPNALITPQSAICTSPEATTIRPVETVESVTVETTTSRSNRTKNVKPVEPAAVIPSKRATSSSDLNLSQWATGKTEDPEKKLKVDLRELKVVTSPSTTSTPSTAARTSLMINLKMAPKVEESATTPRIPEIEKKPHANKVADSKWATLSAPPATPSPSFPAATSAAIVAAAAASAIPSVPAEATPTPTAELTIRPKTLTSANVPNPSGIEKKQRESTVADSTWAAPNLIAVVAPLLPAIATPSPSLSLATSAATVAGAASHTTLSPSAKQALPAPTTTPTILTDIFASIRPARLSPAEEKKRRDDILSSKWADSLDEKPNDRKTSKPIVKPTKSVGSSRWADTPDEKPSEKPATTMGSSKWADTGISTRNDKAKTGAGLSRWADASAAPAGPAGPRGAQVRRGTTNQARFMSKEKDKKSGQAGTEPKFQRGADGFLYMTE